MCTNQELQIVTQEVVTSVLDALADKIYKVILYGSYARGDFTSESDIDIMIILDCTREEVSFYRKKITRLASRIGLKHDIMVTILLRDRESFYNQQDVLPFYENIAKEGLVLYG